MAEIVLSLLTEPEPCSATDVVHGLIKLLPDLSLSNIRLVAVRQPPHVSESAFVLLSKLGAVCVWRSFTALYFLLQMNRDLISSHYSIKFKHFHFTFFCTPMKPDESGVEELIIIAFVNGSHADRVLLPLLGGRRRLTALCENQSIARDTDTSCLAVGRAPVCGCTSGCGTEGTHQTLLQTFIRPHEAKGSKSTALCLSNKTFQG